MDVETCRKILGISPGASAGEIRRTWRRLVRRWHPDRFARNPDMRTFAEERLKEINQAWAQLAPLLEKETTRPAGPATMKAKKDRASRPGILKTIRRIHLKQILRDIFADPAGSGAPAKQGTGNAGGGRTNRGAQPKSFDQVFEEISKKPQSGRSDPTPRRSDATVAGPSFACRMPPGIGGRAGKVAAIEVQKRAGQVRRPARVRGIGSKK